MDYNIHEKHRSRLDEKILNSGIESLAEHEILEFILFAVIPRGDTNHIAHNLINKFGSITGVFNADIDSLTEVEGIGKRAATFLMTMPQVIGYAQRGILYGKNPPKLETPEEIGKYACTFFFGKLVENAYMFSINSSYRLLNTRKLSDGVTSETPVYPPIVVKAAILDNASGVILAHNHPGGVLKPSASDITLTRKLYEALKSVDIVLVDSVIVCGGECLSMRDVGFISDILDEEIFDKDVLAIKRAKRRAKEMSDKWRTEK